VISLPSPKGYLLWGLLAMRQEEFRRDSRKGIAIATDEKLARIAKVPKREFMRRGISPAHAGEDLQTRTR